MKFSHALLVLALIGFCSVRADKAYAVQGDKVRSYTVGVTGVLIDGVGHGTATLKKPACSWPVTVW